VDTYETIQVLVRENLMAITQAICDSYKVQLLQGMHNLTVLTGTNTVSSVAAAGGTLGPNATACTVYTGTFTNGGTNAYAGLVLSLSGFSTAANNGTFLCVASTTTTITLTNPNGANSGTMGTVFATANVFAIALFTSAASLDKTTTKYASTNEVGSSGTYVTGGIGPGGTLVGNAMALVSTTPVLSTDTACALFSTISWTTATITARGALIYNASLGGQPSVLVLNFTTDQTSTAGTFTITFPAQTASNAIIQLL
jgi:hypothetical protein